MSLDQLSHFKIYDFPYGQYPARVRIALGEKGLESLASFEMIDLRKGDHKSAEYQKLNYSGKVPVLELDDGTLIAESTAITEYLDGIIGEPLLTGLTPLERAKIQMMTKRAENEFLEPISLYFHNATRGFGPEVEIYQNKEWGLYQREKGFKGLHYFNELLKNKEFVTCDRFTMADAAVIAAMLLFEVIDDEVPKECDVLIAWYARMQERPSFKNRIKMSET